MLELAPSALPCDFYVYTSAHPRHGGMPMNTILLTIGLFWITVAAYGLTRQRPAEFWRTLTGDAAITRELWGRWTIPVRAMRLTFAPTVFVCAVTVACGWMLLQLVFGSLDDTEENGDFDMRNEPERSMGGIYNYATGEFDDGCQPGGIYDWNLQQGKG
jgi:hypothetical protein